MVIDKQIRDHLGIEAGYLAAQRLVGDHVEIRFFPPEHDRSLRGVLARAAKRSVKPENWREARERAWRQAAKERTAREKRRG